jgi:hypothetical protein
MKKLIISLAAILLLTLPLSAAKAKGPKYGSGIRSPFFGPVVDSKFIEGYQIIHTIWTVRWTGTMEGESVYDHIIIESPDRLRLSWEGIDTFRGTVGNSEYGTASFKVTGRTLREAANDQGTVEGHFAFLKGTGGLANLDAHGVFQRQHDQPVGAYAIVYNDTDKRHKREDDER